MAEENVEIKKLIDDNTNYYEKCLLSYIITDVKFWKDNCQFSLNTQRTKYSNFKDFTKPIDNIIYDTANSFYRALSINGLIAANVKLSKDIIKNLVEAKLKENLLAVDEVKQVELRITDIFNSVELDKTGVPVLSIQELVKNGFDYWLDSRRTKQVTADAFKSGSSSDDLVNQLKAATSRLKQNKIDNRSISDILASYREDEDDSWERFPVANLSQLTRIMGGGLKKKESMLVVAPSGGGKTTIACQIATGLCLADRHVCYITTEQPDGELLPKITSCGASIPYDKIKDGFYRKNEYGDKVAVLEGEEAEEVAKFWDQLNGRLFFENWCDSGSRVKTDLDNVIEKHKELNDIDVVILDWIGGGIDLSTSSGNMEYRMILREGCRQIKELAHKYNVAIIVMAQAGTRKTQDVKAVNATHIDEFTEMHQYFTWGLGISALGVNPKGNFSGEVENRSTKQFFNLFKTRKSGSKLYPVITDFAYSRFIEANGLGVNIEENKPKRSKIENVNSAGVYHV